jgi:hypothetical protein
MATIGKRLGENFNCEPASFTIRRSNTGRSEPPSAGVRVGVVSQSAGRAEGG